MSKSFMVVTLAIAVAAGGYFFLVVNQAPQSADTYVPPVEEENVTGDIDEGEDVDVAVEPVAVATPAAPAKEDLVAEEVPENDAGAVDGEDVEKTLSELDTLFEEDYDDSDLDASFEDNLDQSYGF